MVGGWFFFDIQVCILFLCVVYAVHFFCFRSIYIRFYFSFLTLWWIDNEDGPNVNTVDTEFTMMMCLMRGVVFFTSPRLRKVLVCHETHGIRGAFLLREI